jgi:hypothetical protein
METMLDIDDRREDLKSQFDACVGQIRARADTVCGITHCLHHQSTLTVVSLIGTPRDQAQNRESSNISQQERSQYIPLNE